MALSAFLLSGRRILSRVRPFRLKKFSLITSLFCFFSLIFASNFLLRFTEEKFRYIFSIFFTFFTFFAFFALFSLFSLSSLFFALNFLLRFDLVILLRRETKRSEIQVYFFRFFHFFSLFFHFFRLIFVSLRFFRLIFAYFTFVFASDFWSFTSK